MPTRKRANQPDRKAARPRAHEEVRTLARGGATNLDLLAAIDRAARNPDDPDAAVLGAAAAFDGPKEGHPVDMPINGVEALERLGRLAQQMHEAIERHGEAKAREIFSEAFRGLRRSQTARDLLEKAKSAGSAKERNELVYRAATQAGIPVSDGQLKRARRRAKKP